MQLDAMEDRRGILSNFRYCNQLDNVLMSPLDDDPTYLNSLGLTSEARRDVLTGRIRNKLQGRRDIGGFYPDVYFDYIGKNPHFYRNKPLRIEVDVMPPDYLSLILNYFG